MNKTFRNWTGSLVAAAAVSPLFMSPAQAAPCVVSGMSAIWSYADVDATFACTVGDKTFSLGTLGTLGGLPSNSTFTFTDMGLQHTLSVGGSFTGTSLNGSWKYKITATDFPPIGLYAAQTGATVGLGGSTPTTTIDVSSGGPSLGTNTSLPGGGNNNPPAMFTPVGYLDVTTSWANSTGIGGNTIGTITDKFAQKDIETQVPGPLPILGAGVAFGFAKRARRRISAAA